jgi:hypothetical protein
LSSLASQCHSQPQPSFSCNCLHTRLHWRKRNQIYCPEPPLDPFADASKGDDLLCAGTDDYVHIRIQEKWQENLAAVHRSTSDYNKKKLMKVFKKKFG